MTRPIRIKVAVDRSFSQSFFRFDIDEEVEKASKEFKRQFGAGFEITERVFWNSSGNLLLFQGFPTNLLKQLERRDTEEELIHDVVAFVVNKMKIPWSMSDKAAKEMAKIARKGLKNQSSQTYRSSYIIGFLHARLLGIVSHFLRDDLEKKVRKGSADLVLGFTAKLLHFFNEFHKSGGCGKIGSIGTESAFALIGINYQSPNHFVILHEVGHIFGAKHVEIPSIMNAENPSISDFDPKNKKTIEKSVKKLN